VSSPDVIVVGGGVIGACTALELAQRGAAVTLLERGAELAWACSSGNAGLICPSHATPLANPAALRDGLRWMWKPDSPLYLRPRAGVMPWIARFTAAAASAERVAAGTRVIRELSTASLALHAELAERGLDTGFHRRGSLNVYRGAEAFAAARKEAEETRRAGQRVEVLEGQAAREIEPALGGAPAGAVFYPDDAHCDPYAFVHAVGRAAVEAGARVRPRTEVLALRRRNGRVDAVQTTTGELAAGAVVVAAGAWTPQLVRPLGVYAPVEGGKGYHVDLESGEGDPQVPLWSHDTRVIATPLAGRLRLAGTLELAGLDLSVSRRRVDAIMRAGRELVAGIEGRRVLEIWRGLRPCSPDGLPIVGAPAGCENVVLASGHGMLGLTLGPVTGRLVAELVTGAEPSHDPAPLSPDRFQPLLGRE
jgi:D-amino-acid dehydrogenase